MPANIQQLSEFSIPVRRSIIKRDLWLGIPLVPLLVLMFFSLLICAGFEQWAFLIVTVVVFFLLRKITKEDEWLLDIIIFSLLQPDHLR